MRLIFACAFAATLMSCSFAADVPPLDTREVLVHETLRRALVEEEIPDLNLLLEQRGPVVVSTENIDPDWIPELPGFEFLILDPAEIHARANDQGDYLYLRFDIIEIHDETHAEVSISNTWAVSDNSTVGYLSGGGFTIEYTLADGEWEGEIIIEWISLEWTNKTGPVRAAIPSKSVLLL